MSESSPNIQRLAVKLIPKAERLIKQGHPWVFSDSITKINKEGRTGDLAIIFDTKTNAPFAIGLYDDASPIRIKIISNQKETIDAAFFKQKISDAFDKRVSLLQTATTSYRLIFGENDHFPALIADVYGTVLVVKLYSGIWFPYLDTIFPLLLEISSCETLVLRLSRNLQKNTTIYKDGMVVIGTLSQENVPFTEHGLHFEANVIKGHKTGYFLDHRDNRKRVGAIAKSKTVLDVFSYAGGFSVHALAGGAKTVTSLDISEKALAVAKRNASLNTFSGKHSIIAGDAFLKMKELIDNKQYYDIVVVDPPSFAKRASEVAAALHSYEHLIKLAIKLVAKNGILVMASCSSRISATEFFELVERKLATSAYKWSVQEQTFHDIDHPITFPEGAYLKCGYYKRL